MQTCFWQVAEIISSNVPVAHCSLSEESSFVGSVKKGRHRRSHRRTLLPEAMPIGVPSAAHRLAVLPMCQPLICHRALVTMSQSLDGAPSRLCRKPGRSAASVPPACPFPFPVQQPHARFRHPCSPAFPGEFPYPVLLLSANPSTPSRHIAGSCPAFPGRKKGCGAKKSVSCSRYCRPGSSIPQLRSLPPSSKLFSKKRRQKVCRDGKRLYLCSRKRGQTE